MSGLPTRWFVGDTLICSGLALHGLSCKGCSVSLHALCVQVVGIYVDRDVLYQHVCASMCISVDM